MKSSKTAEFRGESINYGVTKGETWVLDKITLIFLPLCGGAAWLVMTRYLEEPGGKYSIVETYQICMKAS